MRLKYISGFDLTVPEPFDYRLTVRKPAGWHWSTPKEVFDKGVLWTGLYLDKRQVGIKILGAPGGVYVDAFTAKPLSEKDLSELTKVIRAGLGVDEDMAGFYLFAAKDPVLAQTVKDLHGMRVGRLDDLFGRVLLAILLQMAPLARSEQMMSSVLEDFGTKIEFDGKVVVLWPTPNKIVAAGENALRTKAKLGYRAKRLVMAAGFLKHNPMSLLQLDGMVEEEAHNRLTEIPGIGRYSARIILGKTSVPVDVWSVVVMSELFFGHTPKSPRQEVDSIADSLKKRWGKWSWMAFVYVLNDLENLAKSHRLTRLQ